MTNHASRRRTRLAARLLAGALAVGTLTSVTSPVFAQGDKKKELTPPVPSPPQKPAGFLLGIGAALVFGALVIGVNFIPSKRGHQD
jgi:hypothetical protein